MTPEPRGGTQLRVMEMLEQYGYITAGLSFLFLGMIVFAYGWYQFALEFRQSLSHAVLTLMNDLLLVVILLELFRTVINFLKSRSIRLEPFLHVGIIASIRRILTIGAEMTLLENISPDRFVHYLYDYLVNGAVILVLVLSLFLHWRMTGGEKE